MAKILMIGAGELKNIAWDGLVQDPQRDVVRASQGSDALALARQVAPDLAACQINLPDMSGLALYDLWQADPRLRSIPFVFLPPSSGSEEDASASLLRDITERKQVELELANQSLLNATVADLSTQLLQADTIQKITEQALNAALKLTSSLAGYVGYIDPLTGNLVTPAMTRAVTEKCHMEEQTMLFEESNGLYGWVLIHKTPLLTNDAAADARAAGTPTEHFPIRRFLAVPALQGSLLVGQIAVANAGRDYDQRDVQALERLASVYALGVQRVRAEDALRQSEEKFRSLIEQSSEGVALTDEQGAVIEWNQAMERITGRPRMVALGQALWDINFEGMPVEVQTPETYQHMKTNLLDALRTGYLDGMGQPSEMLFNQPDGERRFIEHTGFIIQTDQGYRIAGVISDITERKWDQERRAMLYQATQEISASVSRGQVCAAIHKTAAQVMPVDSIVIALLVNDGFEVQEVYLYDNGRQYPGERRPLGEGLSSYIMTSGTSLRCEDLNQETLVEQTQSIHFGEEIDLPLRAIAVPMRWGDHITGMLSVQSYSPRTYQQADQELIEMLAAYGAIAFENAAKTTSLEQEVAEHRLVRVELERLAKTDPLTGLLNRRHFFTLAEGEFNKSVRYQRPLSVIMLDTDHFKKINDQYGHAIGDQALMALAKLMMTSVRNVDIVARYGGEEFVILLPETFASGALVLAERIRVLVEKNDLQFEGSSVSFTVSLGVADNDHACDCSRFDEVLARADKALYQAKAAGRNRALAYPDIAPISE